MNRKERLKKKWSSPIYTLFEATPAIEHIGTCRSHLFQCASRGCKVTIRQYLDTKDAHSTGNMWKYARKCRGDEAVNAVDEAKGASEAHMKVEGGILKNGKLTTVFKKKSKNRATYLNVPLTREETSVTNPGFLFITKTGRPNHYIPCRFTVVHDVCMVFMHTCNRIANMLREYEGKLNLMMDAWTSPNHCAFMAICIHLEKKGVPLTMLLDLVEVAKV
ncbi:hypothetical protein OG21DRAFT_1425029 [Imleria badia]|nr:hypothetical protein OG21DRAFT_1425029 [Imleria badia]